MQEMIALVASVIIAGVLLLALFVSQWRIQHTSIDATQYSAAKQGMLDLADTLEEDLSNLGAGIPQATMTTTSAIQAFDTTGGTREFRFYSRPRSLVADTLANFGANPRTANTAHLISYQWAATGETVRVFRPATNTFVSVPTYRITRRVNGSAAGESLDTITRIRFDLFDASGTPTGAGTGVRTLVVSLRAVSPLGGGGADVEFEDASPHISETRWHKRFRPANLGRPVPLPPPAP